MSALQELEALVRELGVKGALAVEERDPQLHALRFLCRERGEEALPLVVANALVSYQLSMTGERYWWAFARAIARGEALDSFLAAHNKRLLSAKLTRLHRSRRVWQGLRVGDSYGDLYHPLRQLFGEQKTVSFAVKMFGYFKRACGLLQPFPFYVPIPFDSRVERISKALGVGRRYWQGLAERTGVPPLHIDSLLWNALAFEGRSPLERILRPLLEG